MMRRIDIAGVQYHVEDDLRRYIRRKIGKLEAYMPRHSRASAHAEVKLRESTRRNKKQCSCEVILHLPHETLAVHESTMNMFAAVDIVEEKLKNQIKKYKQMHQPGRRRQLYTRLVGKVRGYTP